MVVDVAPLLRGELKRIDIDYVLSPEQIEGFIFEDARIVGSITDDSGYMRLKLQASLAYHGECARCLAPINGVFSLDFERTVTTEGTIDEDKLEELEDEYVVLNGSELSVDEALCEELSLAFPTKQLCSEDCPGLCPKCGKPLRDGACGCSTVDIDPRLAVLASLLGGDKNDEE